MKRKALVVGIILLFVATCIIPSTAQTLKKLSLPSLRGNWLYVGGSGPGNYSKIQDAINASSDGDTIFVYDDSSPYYGFFDIDKSISLIGENKNTTILDAQQKRTVVHILADNVLLTGFTVQNGSKTHDPRSDGIWIYHDSNVMVIENIIRDSFTGVVDLISFHSTISQNIMINNSIGIDSELSYSIIQNNTILHQQAMGIQFSKGHVRIEGNTISESYQPNDSWGIVGYQTSGNFIIRNNISNFYEGIMIGSSSFFNIVSQNNIRDNNRYGIKLTESLFNIITKNNLIENNQNAYFQNSFRNHWMQNYWDDWTGKGPERIVGIIATPQKILNWVNFDWHPAKEPYAFGER